MNKHPLGVLIALVLTACPAFAAGTSNAATDAAKGAAKGAAKATLAEPAGHREDGAAAIARFVEQFDSSGDGRVDRAEFDAFRLKRYAETDENGDGSVEVDEYVLEYAVRNDRQIEAARARHVEQTHTRFRSLDADGNGYVDRAEYDASGTRAFARGDADKNGRIEAADPEPGREAPAAAAGTEMVAAKAASTGAARASGAPRRDVIAMPSTHTRAGMLEIYDADGDGAVSREEFDRLRGEAYARTDANGDGRIDAEEYLLEFEDRLDRQIARTRENRDKQSAVRFKALDTDKDGRISPAEYAASGKRMFERLDTNGDGVVAGDDPPPPPRENAAGAASR
ncbi:MAG TPA: EF-hand domain-containing protein [Dokdonella sp.]|uniref:EF-hand domain-containing protein n=1 Tax=Dokdonella sp. TaxID=2291710 RepID=UPI002B85FC60|nr:EF-hand domain-containing protein [Dokdonella sp.]HUD40604.1 EF-hand domain-containing protein [Dokdonella sp.]